MNSGGLKIGPVVAPIFSTQFAPTHPGMHLDGRAAIGGSHAACAPVGNRLNGLAKELGKRRWASCRVNGPLDWGALFHTCDGTRVVYQGQQDVAQPIHNLFMTKVVAKPTPVWDRVIEQAKAKSGKGDDGKQWLYTALGYSKQRIAHWPSRDIPPKEYGSVAHVLGKSLSWVATGFEDQPAPEPKPDHMPQLLAMFASMTPDHLAAMLAFGAHITAPKPLSAPRKQRRRSQKPVYMHEMRRTEDRAVKWVPTEFLSVRKKQ